jgi:hypothetical protein
MAPKKGPVETYLTDDRKQEIKDMLGAKGLEENVNVRELEKLDEALRDGWTIPSSAACMSAQKSETGSAQKKKLVTYAVRSARDHLGETVTGSKA